MMAIYSEPGMKGGFRVFTDHRESMEPGVITDAITVLATSVAAVVHIFQKVADHVKDVTLLAERVLYEEGKWPEGEEYPVKRS